MQVSDDKFKNLRNAWLAFPSGIGTLDASFAPLMQELINTVTAIVGTGGDSVGSVDVADMIDDRELVEAGVRVRPIPTTMRMSARGVDVADHDPIVRVRIGTGDGVDLSPDDARRVANALVRAACRAEVSR